MSMTHAYANDYCGLMEISHSAEPRVKATFSVFHRLSPEDYERYATAYGNVRNALENDLVSYAQESFRQLENLRIDLRGKLSQLSTPLVEANVHSWHRTVQCSTLSFASSIHLFYEQTIARIRRLNPESTQEVEDAFKNEYDNCFAYRLLYRLRNVMVHHSLGCVSLQLSGAEEKTPGGLVLHKHTVAFPLRRDRFLETRQGVSAALREEIRALPEDPDLYILSKEALSCVRRISENTFEASHPNIRQECRAIVEMNALFSGKSGTPALVRIPNFDGEFRSGMKLPHTTISPHIVQFAEKGMSRSD